MTSRGGGKRTCTIAAPSTISGRGGKRTSTRYVPSTLVEREKKSVPMGVLVQGHGNSVGGNYVQGKLDRSKEFADCYAAINSASFSSDTDDDGALKPTAHSKKINRKKKDKTPHSYFNGKCGCGCELGTHAVIAKVGETKRGKTDWDRELLTCPDVSKKQWYTLCKFGLYINCNICHGSHVKMWRCFDESAWNGSGGHFIVTKKTQQTGHCLTHS